jgi:hypothetical protein
MKRILFTLLASLALFACAKKENKDKIVGKWRGGYQENPMMDSLIRQQLEFIDTVGRNTTPEQNMAEYGTSNMDSFKALMKEEITMYKAQQEEFMKQTIFEFRKDKVALFNFSGQIDSANWYFNEEGDLILDEMKLKGSGDKLTMTVIYLTDTAMKLKFNENDFNGSVVFYPEKK